MREIERLYRLQELDNGLALHERKVQEWIGQAKRLEQSLAETRQACQESEKAVPRHELALRQAEGSLWEQEGHLKELEKRLYSNTIRSEKEARALQAEIEQARQKKDTLESEALQLMLGLDEMRTRLGNLAEEEGRNAQDYQALLQEISAKEAALQEQVAPLRAARAALVAEISPAALALYDQVRRACGGTAVARVVDNTCTGCHLEVALLTRKAAMGEALVRCEDCGRILYLS